MPPDQRSWRLYVCPECGEVGEEGPCLNHEALGRPNGRPVRESVPVVEAVLTPEAEKRFEWEGRDSEDFWWSLGIDTDRFNDVDPFVVCLQVKWDDADGDKGDGLLMLSPQQAREAAACLLRNADNVEFNERRAADFRGSDKKGDEG